MLIAKSEAEAAVNKMFAMYDGTLYLIDTYRYNTTV